MHQITSPMMKLRGWMLCFGWLVLVTSMLPWETASAAAGDLKFEARLIWGTDDAKPKGREIRDLDPKILDKLKGVFKWKNYFEIDHKDIVVGKASASKVKMSSKCELEVTWLAENRVEVTLIGEGKPVLKKKQPVTPGELMVIAGDSQDATAWFVILTPSKND